MRGFFEIIPFSEKKTYLYRRGFYIDSSIPKWGCRTHLCKKIERVPEVETSKMYSIKTSPTCLN